MSLTPFDDYPIHQTAMPVAHPASGDRNHYDRYFFNGYAPGGEWFFALAMGLYPNRRVIDAAFSVVRDGIQRSVFASGRAPLDRGVTRVGPISIEIVEPLRVSRVRVDGSHLGLEADLTWLARTAALEEPRQTIMDGHVTVLDATRLVQWGAWNGFVDAGGRRLDIANCLGTKDRSWGVRPIGEPPGGAPGAMPVGGGLFFLWAPVNFDDECTHLILFEHPDGRRWYWSSARVPLVGDGGGVWGAEESIRHVRSADYELRYRPGSRRSRGATITLDGERLELEPVLDFQMKGLGYFHPKWAHGVWHGEGAEGSDEWKVDDLDPLELPNLHVEQLCRVRMGAKTGMGVLEQLIIGPHEPTGLTGFLDGA